MSRESKLNDDKVAGSSKVISNSEEHDNEEIDQLMKEAMELYKAESFGDAADKYEIAVRKATEFYGEFAAECFQPALNYGKALIEVARLNTQIVDQPPLELDKIYEEDEADEEEEEMEDEEKPVEEEVDKESQQKREKSAEHKEVAELLAEYKEMVAGDGTTDNEMGGQDKQKEEEAEEEDDADDIQTAWEWLEVARKICEKQEQTSYWLQWKSDVLMALGECMSVADEFEQALGEYLNALEIRQKILEPHDRYIAETHFFIALTHKNMGKFVEAADQYEKTKQVLEAKLAHVKKALESGATNSETFTKKEIAEIEDLIKSVEENIRDAKESAQSSTQKIAGLLPETKTLPNNSEEVVAAAGVEVNDLSRMIKRKSTKRPLVEKKSIGNTTKMAMEGKNGTTEIVDEKKQGGEMGMEDASLQPPEQKRIKVGGTDGGEEGGNVQKSE